MPASASARMISGEAPATLSEEKSIAGATAFTELSMDQI